jgi:hypothetical protein
MATLYIPYTVTEGERWDHIAQKAYGKASNYQPIIAANPTIPITTRLPAGIVLRIPIIPDNNILTDTELIPPWKR